jgi:uncharacterized membrane protein
VNDKDNRPTPAVKHPPRPDWGQILKTTEGRILLLGIIIALVGLIVMGLVAFWSLPTSRMIGTMSVTNIIFGRAVSMSIGYASGYGHTIVVTVNIWVETVLVLLFYPVFVFSIRKLVEFPRLKRFLERTQAAAERHHSTVRRYGIAGLFLFVWIPFWMTGPVIGSAIGYLLGFPAWLTLLVVLAGTYTAMAAWAYLLFDIYTRAASFGPWAPILIICLIILMVIASHWLNRYGKRHTPKESE